MTLRLVSGAIIEAESADKDVDNGEDEDAGDNAVIHRGGDFVPSSRALVVLLFGYPPPRQKEKGHPDKYLEIRFLLTLDSRLPQ